MIPLDPQGADSISQFDVGTLGTLTTNPTAPLATSGQGRQMSSLSGAVEARGMVATGGSDFHRLSVGGILPGDVGVTEQRLAELRLRAG